VLSVVCSIVSCLIVNRQNFRTYKTCVCVCVCVYVCVCMYLDRMGSQDGVFEDDVVSTATCYRLDSRGEISCACAD
jgi:hypothetical protein